MSNPASVPRAPDVITPESTAAVDLAITSRRSIRSFLPTEVPRSVIEDILRVSARAPSGTNTQPWRVHVLTGASLQALVERIMAAHNDPAQVGLHQEEYDYYPKEWISPFVDRRRKVGWDLYSLLIFTIDRIMGKGSLLDYGMFLENIMVAARARGLDTCPQAAFNAYHALISDHLGLDAEREMVVVGMALGHADPESIENSLLSERVEVSDFATFWP